MMCCCFNYLFNCIELELNACHNHQNDKAQISIEFSESSNQKKSYYTYITILLYVVSFRKTILISTIGTHEEIIFFFLKGKFCTISIGENTLSVEYSDIYHVLSHPFPQTRFLFPANFCP